MFGVMGTQLWISLGYTHQILGAETFLPTPLFFEAAGAPQCSRGIQLYPLAPRDIARVTSGRRVGPPQSS